MRDNLPTGVLTAETAAASGVGVADESTWFAFEISPEALVAGTNILAVEVHQSSRTSSDVSFDLMLEVRRTQDFTPIMLHGTTQVKSRLLNSSQWSAISEASFTTPE